MNSDRQHQSKLRRLNEKEDFLKNCREFSKEYSRFSKLLIGLRYDLQEFAHLEENHKGCYWKDTAAVFDMPSFTVMYTIDNGTVNVYDIEVKVEEP